MPLYTDAEIDEAIERLANDVTRRLAHPDVPHRVTEAFVDQLRAMEAARRGGDLTTAATFAARAGPALDAYRPTNATSRSKAVLAEVVGEILGPTVPPAS